MINNPFYFKAAIDKLEFCCMDPDMEHHYKELLQLWKNDEDNIKDELKEISTDVKEINTNVKEIDTDVKEINTDVKEIGTDVKEIKEITKKLDDMVASTGTPVGQSSNEDGEYIAVSYTHLTLPTIYSV